MCLRHCPEAPVADTQRLEGVWGEGRAGVSGPESWEAVRSTYTEEWH